MTPQDSRQLSDLTECTTFDCDRIAVRMVEIEDQGEHPYCRVCAAILERSRGDDDKCQSPGEVARLRAALEKLADPDSWERHERPHRHTVKFAREALNGGDA
jgi:hypothetical protein